MEGVYVCETPRVYLTCCDLLVTVWLPQAVILHHRMICKYNWRLATVHSGKFRGGHYTEIQYKVVNLGELITPSYSTQW